MADAEKKKINNMIDSVKNLAGKVSGTSVSVVHSEKSTAVQLKDDAKTKQLEQKNMSVEKRRLDVIKKYSPIFREDVAHGELLSERVIRIVNYNARLENETCKDSIGFYEKTKDRKLPTLYSKYVPSLGLEFYPQQSESVFISDPKIPGKYIEIDEYYNYMKTVRVNELMVLAQALGAKSVNIQLRNASKSIFQNKASMNANAGKKADANGNRELSRKQSKYIEIWDSATFKPAIWNGTPVVPKLLYFSNESDIDALIQMVTVNKTKLANRTYSMHANSSSGMSLTEASSIVATLKTLKCSAGSNFEKMAEAQNEAFLEYTIEFL